MMLREERRREQNALRRLTMTMEKGFTWKGGQQLPIQFQWKREIVDFHSCNGEGSTTVQCCVKKITFLKI